MPPRHPEMSLPSQHILTLDEAHGQLARHNQELAELCKPWAAAQRPFDQIGASDRFREKLNHVSLVYGDVITSTEKGDWTPEERIRILTRALVVSAVQRYVIFKDNLPDFPTCEPLNVELALYDGEQRPDLTDPEDLANIAPYFNVKFRNTLTDDHFKVGQAVGRIHAERRQPKPSILARLGLAIARQWEA